LPGKHKVIGGLDFYLAGGGRCEAVAILPSGFPVLKKVESAAAGSAIKARKLNVSAKEIKRGIINRLLTKY
jgi:hypothetical protein